MKRRLAEIDAKLRSRIRVIIWKQWKSYSKRICSLVQLGIPEEAKGLTYYRKGYRFIGLSKVDHRFLSNERLKQRGILFTLDYYLKVHTVIQAVRHMPNGLYGDVRGVRIYAFGPLLDFHIFFYDCFIIFV